MTRLILFDIDGTLLRTKGAGRRATHDSMLEVFGTASTVATHDFGGKPDWLTLVELLRDHDYDIERVLEHLPAFEAAMGRHLSRYIVDHPAFPCPGAMETVVALRERPDVLRGIVTGNTRTSAQVKLRAAGYDPDEFITGAFGTESMDRNDLPPLAIQRAAAAHGTTINPRDVFIVGDTLADLQSARAVGAVAVAVTTGFTAREVLAAANPDYLLDDLRDLLPLV